MSLRSGVPDLLVENFAVCGLPEEPTPYDVSEILANGEEIVLSESKCLDFSHYSTPIVDIQIVNLTQGENIPDGYTPIQKTHDETAECFLQSTNNDVLLICYRRGYDKPPIMDIDIVDVNTKVLAGCFKITRSIGNHSAVLVKKRFTSTDICLSYSRLTQHYGVDRLALTQICLVMKNKRQLCPLGFRELPTKVSTVSLLFKKIFAQPQNMDKLYTIF